MNIKERLVKELMYLSEEEANELFMPEDLDKAFVGFAQTDWHYGRPVYDASKIEGGIPETPEGMKDPIYFSPGSLDEKKHAGVIVFDPQGLNKAITGVTFQNQAVYEYNDLIHVMMEVEDWDEESAVDWISYNTLRDYSYRDQGPVVYMDITYFLDDEE